MAWFHGKFILCVTVHLQRGANRQSRLFSHNSHSLLVTVEKISWRIVDECEVRFFLFDGEKELLPFTESVQCTFRGGEMPKLPIKMLFTVRSLISFIHIHRILKFKAS